MTETPHEAALSVLAAARIARCGEFGVPVFCDHVEDADRLGLAVARLIMDRLLGCGELIVIAFGDKLFRRWHHKVHHAFGPTTDQLRVWPSWAAATGG